MAEENLTGEVLYSWQAKEFAVSNRGPWWYIAAGAILLAAVAYTIYTREWMTLAVVVMIGVVLYLLQKTSPRVFDHQLTTKGVMVGKTFYNYPDIRSFWVVLDLDNPVVNLMLHKKFSLLVTLQAGGADVEKIRSILSDFVVEEPGRGEDTIDKIGRFLKF